MLEGHRVPSDFHKHTLGFASSVTQHVHGRVCRTIYRTINLIESRTKILSALTTIVRHEFVAVREALAELDYPNFSSDTKFRLVVDEAKILSDKNPMSF